MKGCAFYRLELTLTAPLALGDGSGVETKKDVFKDGEGRPMIPGTSLAGVLRKHARALYGDAGTGFVNSIFGSRDASDESRLIVYDMRLSDEKGHRVSTRTHVRIDDLRRSVDKFLYNNQIVEPGAVFVGYLELPYGDDPKLMNGVEEILARFIADDCRLGGKISRGCGTGRLNVTMRDFDDLSSEDIRRKYLDFRPERAAENAWDAVDLPAGITIGDTRVEVAFRMPQGLSIREYSTEVNAPDSHTLRVGESAVIPGSSWAGAIIARVCALSEALDGPERADAIARELFGIDEYHNYNRQENAEKRRSRVSFYETLLDKGQGMCFTRNALDRFSGKGRDQALFSGEAHYGGEGTLVVRIEPEVSAEGRQLLACALSDLLNGFLAVGGQTSIGRGIIQPITVTVDGATCDEPDDMPAFLLEKLAEAPKQGMVIPIGEKKETEQATKKAPEKPLVICDPFPAPVTLEAFDIPEWLEGAYYLAILTDRVVTGRYTDGRFVPGFDGGALLEVRIFNAEGEWRAHREHIGEKTFSFRTIRDVERTDMPYMDEVQYLDQSSTTICADGRTSYVTTGGSAYSLPLPARYAKVRMYYETGLNGMQYMADWRIVDLMAKGAK